MGQLLGKPEANPKEYVNALHLRSGRQLPSGDHIEDNANQDEEVEHSTETKDTVPNDENTEIEAKKKVGEEKEKDSQYRPVISTTGGRYRPQVVAIDHPYRLNTWPILRRNPKKRRNQST
ncbi:unnamed protein product [Cochlearia groenlandica]